MAESGKKRRRYSRGNESTVSIAAEKQSPVLNAAETEVNQSLETQTIGKDEPTTKPSESEMLVAQIMHTADSVDLNDISQEEAMQIATDITAQLRLLGPDAYSAMGQNEFNLLAKLMSKLLGKGQIRKAG